MRDGGAAGSLAGQNVIRRGTTTMGCVYSEDQQSTEGVRVRKSVAVVVAAVGLVGACSSGGEPHAVAEPTRWDPCSITPEQIAATGLDPDYREAGWGEGIAVDDWARCAFAPAERSISYVLSIKSSVNRTIREARTDSSNLAGRDFQLDGRDAFQYKTNVGNSIDDCNVAIELHPGIVVFTLNYMEVDDGTDPCALLEKYVADLDDALPPN